MSAKALVDSWDIIHKVIHLKTSQRQQNQTFVRRRTMNERTLSVLIELLSSPVQKRFRNFRHLFQPSQTISMNLHMDIEFPNNHALMSTLSCGRCFLQCRYPSFNKKLLCKPKIYCFVCKLHRICCEISAALHNHHWYIKRLWKVDSYNVA